ncbi:unnamed protein product [Protopolystoma xenopodis]|uniref:Uncharacterized protein n=1 Tax=Protopolystoma xenopodis TaxID=117903 RepID=A0A448WN54_9PLAT|nr:unnamed protein product [Protopolystoma xenopodis]
MRYRLDGLNSLNYTLVSMRLCPELVPSRALNEVLLAKSPADEMTIGNGMAGGAVTMARETGLEPFGGTAKQNVHSNRTVEPTKVRLVAETTELGVRHATLAVNKRNSVSRMASFKASLQERSILRTHHHQENSSLLQTVNQPAQLNESVKKEAHFGRHNDEEWCARLMLSGEDGKQTKEREAEKRQTIRRPRVLHLVVRPIREKSPGARSNRKLGE